jgi:hypothetical protein
MRAAGSISVTSSFEEVLLLWRKSYFAPGGPGETLTEWTGNPTALQGALNHDTLISPIVSKNFSNLTTIGIHLNKLIARNVPYLTTTGPRKYVIARPTS